MGLHFMDSDGIFYVEDKSVIHDDRGHKKILKHFSSEAEAETYLRSLIDKWESSAMANGKHKKTHRPKHVK